MQWQDKNEIIEHLEENYPDIPIENLSITKLNKLIINLEEFDDDPEVAPAVLEEIHEMWVKLREDNY